MEKWVTPDLTEGARFWVVLPRLGLSGISGLGTLVSGSYIELDPGPGESAREFTGLEGRRSCAPAKKAASSCC